MMRQLESVFGRSRTFQEGHSRIHDKPMPIATADWSDLVSIFDASKQQAIVKAWSDVWVNSSGSALSFTEQVHLNEEGEM